MQVKANAGSAARAHVTRASAIRAHSHRLSLAVIVFLFALFVAKVALAEDWYTVLYSSQYGNTEQYIVSADDKWQAAAIICGKSKSYIDGLDDEVRKKLSTNGGAFQTLADSLQKDWPAWNEDTLNDSLGETFGSELWRQMTSEVNPVPSYPFVSFDPNALSKVTIMVWQDTCPTGIFAINADPNLRAAAIEALNLIVGGGSIGGGGTVDGRTFELYQPYSFAIYASSGQNVYPYYSITKDGQTFTTRMNANGTGYSGNVLFEDPIKIEFESDVLPELPSGVTVDDVLVHYQSPYNYLSFYILSSNNLTLTDCSTTSNTGTVKNFKQYVGTYTTSHLFQVNLDSYTITDTSIKVHSFTPRTTTWRTNVYSGSYSWPGTTNVLGFAGVSSGGVGDDEPNPWPVPVPPEEPEVPEPPDVSPPPITGPVFPTDPPQDPTVTPEPEPTGTDYTVYLKAIIRQLNQVMVQMSNHCKHIRDQISTSANAIISNLHTFIEDLQEAIDSNFAALNDYLEDLTKWYEDFTQEIVDGIQDEFSTVESILRQILRKIGIGRGTQKDVEKDVDDDFDFLEWLINFITSKLAGVIDEFVGDVGALINGVKDKFPFSIPWDIAAILAILDGVPVTPNFTITIPAINGWWQATTFNIDLRPYDSVAAAVRIMINAWWVLTLAMKTNWMLDTMGKSTSIGERIANRISGGGE